MGNEERAEVRFAGIAEQVSNFRESKFYRENAQWDYLEDGFEAIADFLLDRPAMLVCDSQNMEVVLQFLNKEWYEAEHAESNEDYEHFFAEVGDTVFFAFVSGILYWDTMSDTQRDFVARALNWCEDGSQHQTVDLAAAAKYVSTVKDPINYRAEFYQLVKEETVDDLRKRVPTIGKLHRKLRERLNGEWAESNDLLQTLAAHYVRDGKSDDTEMLQIAKLFDVAGLDIFTHAYN